MNIDIFAYHVLFYSIKNIQMFDLLVKHAFLYIMIQTIYCKILEKFPKWLNYIHYKLKQG